MGIRIHRAMGWGMSWSDFSKLTKLQEKDGDGSPYWLNHLMYDTFNKATAEDLTLSKEEYREQFKKPEMPILERHLTSRDITTGTKKKPTFGPATNLYFTVGYDDLDFVGFIPALYLHKRWCRYNNDLDYMFEQLRDGSNSAAEARDFATFAKFNPYPWTNELMDHEGNRLPWDYFSELEKRDDWRPAVPAEIRWYLNKLGIMDNKGINELRPMVAQWWS